MRQVELRLPPEPIAASLTRAAVAAAGSGLPEAVASDIELLATEIVSNAVRHANLDPSEEIILRIVADGYVRVEVTDPGPLFAPELSRLDPGPSGWDYSSSTRSRRHGVSKPKGPARRSGSNSAEASAVLRDVRELGLGAVGRFADVVGEPVEVWN